MNGVTLVEIIRFHPDAQQPVYQLLHGRYAVIDAGKEHGLAAQRNSRICQAAAGLARLRCQFLGMGDMDAQPQRMKTLEQAGKGRGDALRQHHRRLGADADELYMGDAPQPGQQPLQTFIFKGQRITA